MIIYRYAQSKEKLIELYDLDPAVAAAAETVLDELGKERGKLMRFISKKVKSGGEVSLRDVMGFKVDRPASVESMEWARTMTQVVPYAKWLARAMDDGRLEEWRESGWDDTRIADVLTMFRSRSALDEFPAELKDVNAYSNPAEIDKAMEPYRTAEERTKEQREADFRNGSELIGTFGDVDLYRLDTREAVSAAAHGTKWCVRDPRAFETTAYGIMPYWVTFAGDRPTSLIHAPTRQWRLPDDSMMTRREAYRMSEAYRYLVDGGHTNYDIDRWADENAEDGSDDAAAVQRILQTTMPFSGQGEIDRVIEMGGVANDPDRMRDLVRRKAVPERLNHGYDRRMFEMLEREFFKYFAYTQKSMAREIVGIMADALQISTLDMLVVIGANKESNDLDGYSLTGDDAEEAMALISERMNWDIDNDDDPDFNLYAKSTALLSHLVDSYVRKNRELARELIDRNLERCEFGGDLWQHSEDFGRILQDLHGPEFFDGWKNEDEEEPMNSRLVVNISGIYNGMPENWRDRTVEMIAPYVLSQYILNTAKPDMAVVSEIVESRRDDITMGTRRLKFPASVLISFGSYVTDAEKLRSLGERMPWLRELLLANGAAEAAEITPPQDFRFGGMRAVRTCYAVLGVMPSGDYIRRLKHDDILKIMTDEYMGVDFMNHVASTLGNDNSWIFDLLSLSVTKDEREIEAMKWLCMNAPKGNMAMRNIVMNKVINGSDSYPMTGRDISDVMEFAEAVGVDRETMKMDIVDLFKSYSDRMKIPPGDIIEVAEAVGSDELYDMGCEKWLRIRMRNGNRMIRQKAPEGYESMFPLDYRSEIDFFGRIPEEVKRRMLGNYEIRDIETSWGTRTFVIYGTDSGGVIEETVEKEENPFESVRSTWFDRTMVRVASPHAEEEDERLIAGLDYYVGEYRERLEGTAYAQWADDGTVEPMRWERVSSVAINVYVTIYMEMKHEGSRIMDELKRWVIRPNGWSSVMTDIWQNWESIDGRKYSVIKMEIQKK